VEQNGFWQISTEQETAVKEKRLTKIFAKAIIIFVVHEVINDEY